MSADIERRVGSLLNTSEGASSSGKSIGETPQSSKNSSSPVSYVKPVPVGENNVAKEKISAELKQQEEKLKVCIIMSLSMHANFFLIMSIVPYGD